MQDVKLSLSIDDINLILEGLGQMPFVRVYTLINNIQTQATQQVDAAEDKSAEVTKLSSKNVAEA